MKPPSKQKMTEYEVTAPVITFHSVELEAESEEQAIVILKLALGHHDNKIENLIKAEPGQFQSDITKPFVTPNIKEVFGIRTVKNL